MNEIGEAPESCPWPARAYGTTLSRAATCASRRIINCTPASALASATLARFSVDEQRRRCIQQLPHPLDTGFRDDPSHHSVIELRRQDHHLPYLHRAVAHRRPRDDAVDADDCHLGVDDSGVETMPPSLPRQVTVKTYFVRSGAPSGPPASWRMADDPPGNCPWPMTADGRQRE